MNKDTFVVRHHYDSEECRIAEGTAEIKEESEKVRAETKEKTQKEMIINMYKDNMSIDLISKYSNLSINQVKDIINKEQAS